MRRPTLHAILALLLVAAFAAPVEAAGAATHGRETLTGTLEAYYVDAPRQHQQGDDLGYDLRTEHGTVAVDFPGRGPRRLIGAKVSAHRERVGAACSRWRRRLRDPSCA